MKNIRRVILGVGLLLFLGGCVSHPERLSGPVPGGTKPQKVEPQLQPVFQKAEKAFNAKQYDQARHIYLGLRQKYPHSRAAMVSSYRLGTIYYYEQEYPSASREFESFLLRYPATDLTFDVTYNAAATEFELNNLEKARGYIARLKKSDIDAQGPRRAEVVYMLSAQIAEAMGDHGSAIIAYAAEIQLPRDESTRSSLGGKVDSHLAKMENRTELDKLLGDITEPETRDKIAKRIASIKPPEPIVAGVIPPSGLSPDAVIPPSVVTSGASGVSGERLNVGVILPLSGKFANYGHKALEGILLASGVYQATSHNSEVPEIHLFIEDSASSPAVARLAVDRLANDDKVMAIIGPLSYKESVAVGERAQELGVVNLSLSSKEGVSEKGSFLFQNALTPKVQLDSLVQFCIKERQFSRFAIVYPTDNFGKDLANQFWDLVEKYGAHVAAVASYAPNQNDFQVIAQEISGVSESKYRRLESAKLWDYIAQEKKKNGREPKVNLPPILDFDGIFVPDSPKRAAQIAASLTYFDISGVPLLGTTEWNSDQLYQSGGRYVEGALFPGAVSAASNNPRQREFFRQYAAAYGTTPDLLAGQAYEAMALVGAALKRTSSSDRGELASQLISLKDFASPLGSLSFDNTRVAQRKLQVFALQVGGNIVPQ